MEYLPAILITAAIIIVIVAAMLLGWRNQHRRHASIPAPMPMPQDLEDSLFQAEGVYVATTTAGDWLGRIHAHDLGDKSNALLAVYPNGVGVWREGEENFFIPATDITAVDYSSGQTGKFVEKDGLIMVTWTLGAHKEEALAVQTGFRPRYSQDKKPLRDALAELMATTAKENNA